MEKEIKKFSERAKTELASLNTFSQLEKFRAKYFGKVGKISKLTKQISSLPVEKRPKIGIFLNQAKVEVEKIFAEKRNQLAAKTKKQIDVTHPGHKTTIGHLHLITQAIEQIVAIFSHLGFNRVRYPEVEWDYYAFEALNMPKDHPARDEWETFFISDQIILTPHTSSGQVREMEKGQLPIRMLNIAKCYRRQSDLSHTPMFHQFEGLLIDRNVSIRELKGVLDYFAQNYYGKGRKTRLRPFHFRFTEPSFEVDVSCHICKGLGCRFCKDGWLELGGAGMVHPAVLKYGGIDSSKFSGLAFGWGVERVLVTSGVKIPDLRYLYQNDLRFLEQF